MNPQIHTQPINAKTILFLLITGTLLTSCDGTELKRSLETKAAEVIGNIATRNMPDDAAGGFHKIPIEVKQIADNVYQATGIANTHLVKTSEGDVLFDSGISIQAAQQLKLLKEKSTDPLKYIILSHSHADHIGGVKFWKDSQTEVIAHREFAEEQRYLTELEPYFWQRNRILFPWMPEQPNTLSLLRYGGVEPDILVDERDYSFQLGGVDFEVLATPGAEGADNISLWLPQQKILFSGDFFGPLFPQFPNIFTMRGEKVRKPVEYIASLNKLIALQPEILVPSHHGHITGKDNIQAALIKMRDAVEFVHNATIDGMNAGKTVYQLMDEIKLPEHLQLTQEHGKVSWAVKSIWEYYATWFHFESPTELYSVPVRDVYPELSELIGTETLVAKAQQHFVNGEPLQAIHLLEIALSNPLSSAKPALQLRLAIYESMLEAAIEGGNNYEKDYLRRLIIITKKELALLE